jgi:MFS superfamily sulfate permease-like transporter
MAKYRHRIFEMYELREEAIQALTPRSERAAMEADSPETWTFHYLTVTRAAPVTHVRFDKVQTFGEETLSDLRQDLEQLADRLSRDSRVLLDFTGVLSMNAASVEALSLFNQRLRMKGSRMVLCSLGPTVRECFFPARSPGVQPREPQ